VRGDRHPDTLTTRALRALALSNLGRYGEALAEIETFAPIEAEVKGDRHPDTLATRYLRALALGNLGRYGEALTEIETFAPIEAEVRGDRHPDTLTTRALRALALSNLGRYGEALTELEILLPIWSDVMGDRHPSSIALRSFQIGVEIAAKRNIDHSGELRKIIHALIDLAGPRVERTLYARYRLARLLQRQGETDAARIEATQVIADFDPATASTHVLRRSVECLLSMIDGGPEDSALVI
jgi:tetratricopeptide (TPR) repeat protein